MTQQNLIDYLPTEKEIEIQANKLTKEQLKYAQSDSISAYVLDKIDKLAAATSRKDCIHAAYISKVMPDDVYARFTELRDKQIPSQREEIKVVINRLAATNAKTLPPELPHTVYTAFAEATKLYTADQVIAYARTAIEASAQGKRQPLGDAEQVYANQKYAELGRAMYEMTTTVHGPEFPFEEAISCIPELWKNCMEHRDNLIAAIASQKAAHGITATPQGNPS